jgi:cytochrome c-type biogenesis protein CcmE
MSTANPPAGELPPLKPLLPASRTRWFAVGALAIAAVSFLAIASGGIGKNLVYYWGPTELKAAGAKAQGATIRLGGQVAPGTIKFSEDTSSLTFDVHDLKATVSVHSQGVPPQMFRENIGVVVEGTVAPNGVFECSRLMVSHDNQYRAPKPGEDVKVSDLMTSTTGLKDGKK